eukprot:58648-Karenia_brevis.AAC.1
MLSEQAQSNPAHGSPAPVLTDATEFSEANWRAMARGSGESARAFEYRTGQSVEAKPDGKRAKRNIRQD